MLLSILLRLILSVCAAEFNLDIFVFLGYIWVFLSLTNTGSFIFCGTV